MGALKDEFHEVIAGEAGAIEALETEYRTAYDAYFALHARLPIYRNREQQDDLDHAYNVMAYTKWKMDSARFWKQYEERNNAASNL